MPLKLKGIKVRKNTVTFVFIALFSFFCISPVCAKQGNVIPVTVGDIERNRTFSPIERIEFIADFYFKNKEIGASDEDIINELLKLFEFDKDAQKEIDEIKQKYQKIVGGFKSTINEINMSILEENPGRTDMIIDIDDMSTWKNIKNISISGVSVEDYIKNLKSSSFFSESVVSDGVTAVLASCVEKKDQKFPMTFILFLKEGYSLVVQEEGKKAEGVQVDFSGSENITFDPIIFPMQDIIKINEKKFFGYQEKVYFPFEVKKTDPLKPAVVHAKITVNVCKDNVCQKQTLPEITYTTIKGKLEGAFCHNIVKEINLSPQGQCAKIEMEKAVFEKSENGNVDLSISMKVPRMSSPNLVVLIKNDQGLNFSEPMLLKDGKTILIKAALLNPKDLKDSSNVILDVIFPYSGAEFNITPSIENKKIKKGVSFLAFSLTDFFKSFLLGIKFFLFTPIFTAFLIFLNQAMFVSRKTDDKTQSFYDGMTNAFYVLIGMFFVVFWLFRLLPVPEWLIWGKQFDSPLINFVFIMIFLTVILYWKKAFDNVAINNFKNRNSKLFSLIQSDSVQEDAGFIVCVITGVLLLITPMTMLYYQVYSLLVRSFIFYSLGFLSGIVMLFWILSFFGEQMEDVEEDERAQRLINLIIPIPLYFQVFVLFLSMVSEVGTDALWESAALICAVWLVAQKAKQIRFKSIITGALIACVFIPFYPTKNNLNVWKTVEFNKELLHQKVAEGKSVYLNVTENFCLSCLWNRFLVVERGAKEDILNGDLTIMRIGYKNPFLKEMLPSDTEISLPMNIVFSPRYPRGKVLDANFELWSVAKNMGNALPIKVYETDPQMWLGDIKLKKKVKDKD